ncbi:MAG: IS66 family insertion sequence element accessory protein TnpB [Treponema sp.]|jgi:transposase|nr:IS66 family insertion sequence element accessory protein TnpB [Treponema sp.]
MTVDLSRVKIYIRPGHTDLRKAVNGLTAIIQEGMELNPLSGSVFLFCNRSRKLLKAVWWDMTGFWLSQKRLEKDKFPWPEGEIAAEELTVEEVKMLLLGIDFWKAHKPLLYQKVL